MSRPRPAEKRFDLVECFDALALAGKKPDVKKTADTSRSLNEPESTFVGGFNPRLLMPLATPNNHRRASPPDANRNARTVAPPKTDTRPVPSSRPIAMPVPIPPAGKISLTMQHALKSLIPHKLTKPTPALPPVTTPARPHSDSIVSPKVASKTPLSAVNGPTQPTLNVTPSRPRAVSVPLSPTTSSAGKGTARCNGVTRAGRRCARYVKLPATHSHIDPTPVLYCHQHKDALLSQPGFYVRKVGSVDKFLEFSQFIPTYLQMDTQLALRVEMEKATSHADVSGYIYTFEIRDPNRTDVIQLKVGRAVNLNRRLDEWDKQCGSKVQIPRGWWPGTVEDDDGTAGSLLKGNIKAGDPGPFCHRVERLVHIELADLSLHAPYLQPGWPNGVSDPTAVTSGTISSRKAAKENKCPDCGKTHMEIFTFPRAESGRYKGKEWDLIVRPVIEKWGRFVKEYYA